MKRKSLLLFFISLLAAYIIAQPPPQSRSTTVTRKYSLRENPAHPFDSILTEEIITDNIAQTVELKQWHNNGKLSRESIRSSLNDLEKVKTYYRSGNKKESGFFRTARWTGNYTSWDSSGCKERDLHFDFSGQRDSMQTYYWKNNCNVPQWKFYFRHGREVYFEKYNRSGIKILSDSIYEQPKADADAAYFMQYTKNSKLVVEDPWPMDSSIKPKRHPHKKQKPYSAPRPKNWDGKGFHYIGYKKGEWENYKLKSGEEYVYNSSGILVRIKRFKDFKYTGDLPLN